MSTTIASRLVSAILGFAILAGACSSLATEARAALVYMDLLGGLGDFEWASTFQWASHGGYAGDDYDWDAETDEWHRAATYVTGSSRARPDDSVAAGWRRVTGATVNPKLNSIYRIAEGEGISGSNCQYFAVRGIAGGPAYVQLHAPPFEVNSKPHDLHVGDRVTFRIDRIRMSGYASVPKGTIVTYRLRLAWSGGLAETILAKSTTPLSAPDNQVTCTVPPGVSEIRAYVTIDVQGDLGASEPGIFLDGAHLLVTRSGETEYAKEVVPVERNRRIKTHRLFLSCADNSDVYSAARSYDYAMLGEEQMATSLRLRYYNPQIKIYLYLLAAVRDSRFDESHEYLHSANALGFLSTLREHPDWLYAYGQYPYESPDTRTPDWKKLRYRFESAYPESPTYYARLTNGDFQRAWSQAAISKALLHRVDGIWIDALTVAGWDVPERAKWEPQAFAQAVMPKLRAAGIPVTANGCWEHLDVLGDTDLDGLSGASKISPWWQPTDFQRAVGYKPNTPSVTAESMQQEWGFFRPNAEDGPQSDFSDTSHWLRCLTDMDTVQVWNTAAGDMALATGERRWLHTQVTARKTCPTPMDGLDGWLRYGLCSYLLAQNDWTTFGCSFHPSYLEREHVDADLGITTRLGNPEGPHLPYNGDQYFRYRLYSRDSSGGVGGVVVVNAHPDATRSYVLPFDAVDEAGQVHNVGSKVTLMPHTGRIFLRAPMISLVMDIPTQSVKPGEEVTVTVTYRNNDVVDADDVVVSTAVPDGLIYSPGSAESTGGIHDASSGSVRWRVGKVAAGQSGSRVFRARVK